MKPYPKIENLFTRNDDGSLLWEYKRPEFGDVKHWSVSEKIDGSCHRLIFHRDLETYEKPMDIGGKTDKAEIPQHISDVLWNMANSISDDVINMMAEHNVDTLTFYGEAYGPKIQSGGKYRDDVNFIVFDVSANGRWLSENEVTDACQQVGLDRVPVISPVSSIKKAIDLVSDGFESYVGKPKTQAEGVVVRTPTPLYDRRRNRLIAKLKTEDFRGTHLD